MPEWQTAASSLLTTLGLRYADKVLAQLMLKFPPGGHPHYFVVRSLGLLAVANGKENPTLSLLEEGRADELCPSSTAPLHSPPTCPSLAPPSSPLLPLLVPLPSTHPSAKAVVPSLNTVIARMLPMLSQAKHDNMQWVFSSSECPQLLTQSTADLPTVPTISGNLSIKDVLCVRTYPRLARPFNLNHMGMRKGWFSRPDHQVYCWCSGIITSHDEGLVSHNILFIVLVLHFIALELTVCNRM